MTVAQLIPIPTDKLEIQSMWVKVTPTQASKWLETNTRNRNLSRSRVEMMARDIAEGRWQQRNVSVAFYTDGRLADGQHRLNAIVLAGVTCLCRIEHGYPLNTQFDDNRARKWSDTARINDERNTTILSTTLKIVYNYATNTDRRVQVTGMERDEILEALPKVRESVSMILDMPVRLRASTFSAFHFVASLMRPKHEATLNEFYEGLKLGTGLEKGNAVHTLREKVIQMPDKDWYAVRSNQAIVWNSLVLAWNHFEGATPLTRINMKFEQREFNEVPGSTRERLLGLIRRDRKT